MTLGEELFTWQGLSNIFDYDLQQETYLMSYLNRNIYTYSFKEKF
jgi:hypothetical protein